MNSLSTCRDFPNPGASSVLSSLVLVQKLNFRACTLKLYLEMLVEGVRAAAMEMSRRLEDPHYILGFCKPDEVPIKYAVSS